MKTLLLLHGWGAAGTIWQRQVEAFSGSEAKVLTPTFPAWDAAWLAGFLQELPLAETVAVGWSLGGMLLLEALSHASSKPRGLVLVATPVSFCQRPDHPWGQPRAAVRALRKTVALDPRRGLTDFAGRCLAAGEENFRETILREFQPGQSGADLAAGLDYLLKADLRPQLAQVPPGATIIQGDRDAIVPLGQAEVLGQFLPKAQVVKIPGAGHAPFLTREEEFNKILQGVVEGKRRERGSPPSPLPPPLSEAGKGGASTIPAS
jgi:pimeloyl-[acyl-carrier protein] methyl ester esterase